jgi:hypothetical protein
MPEKNRQIEQTIPDSWGPRFLEAFKKQTKNIINTTRQLEPQDSLRPKRNRQDLIVDAPGSPEARKGHAKRTNDTQQLEPQDRSRPERTDEKKRIYPTDGDAGSLDARKEQMKRIDNTRQLELQDP